MSCSWALADEIHTLALKLGGTISTQHGTGLARTPWVERQYGKLYPVFRELKATFDLSAFAHEAFYDEAKGRIEIYVRSLKAQTVSIDGRRFEFAAGERVHTEYSYKYDAAGLAALAARGGFRIAETWTDPERLFAVVYLESISRK